MKYSIGVCTSLDRATLAAQLGAEHIEPGFWPTAAMDEPTFRAALANLKDSGLPVDAMNSMLPGTAVLYGTEQDISPTLELVARGMERAAAVGCKTVVFGSGTARCIPEGMAITHAKQHIAALAGRFCEIARPYGIRIAIEPLRAHETNFIHTLSDATEIVALAPRDTDLGVNPDIYHMLEGGESFGELSRLGDKLFHAHICAPDRHYPRQERPDTDNAIYRDFFRALRAAGYTGTLSIEGIVKDMAVELPEALAILHAAQEQA
jgi:sugar phosphate isomerase/epimerase